MDHQRQRTTEELLQLLSSVSAAHVQQPPIAQPLHVRMMAGAPQGLRALVPTAFTNTLAADPLGIALGSGSLPLAPIPAVSNPMAGASVPVVIPQVVNVPANLVPYMIGTPLISNPQMTLGGATFAAATNLPPHHQQLELATSMRMPTHPPTRAELVQASAKKPSNSIYDVLSSKSSSPEEQATKEKLAQLGNSLPTPMVAYVDVLKLPKIQEIEKQAAQIYSKGREHKENFPSVIHRMISEAEQEGFSAIVTWCPHGRAFVIRNENKFVKQVLGRYCRQTKFNSFRRQMNLYGFAKLSRVDPGAYYHPLFLRGHRNLCKYMQRVGLGRPQHKSEPRLAAEGAQHEQLLLTEPNFYDMEPVKAPKASDKKQETKGSKRTDDSAKETA